MFKGENTSVSRLAITSLEDHWDLFRKFVEKPPERWLERIGEVNVGALQQIGRRYTHPAELTVESDPTDWNPAHAVIPQNISRGLANQIIRQLKIHEDPRPDVRCHP
ncbi:MAG: hypothetical protein HY360_20080 [Verrucomicrobia bacterium]|nr:hypothetical protein [Verrucomicrobiota bacterium]